MKPIPHPPAPFHDVTGEPKPAARSRPAVKDHDHDQENGHSHVGGGCACGDCTGRGACGQHKQRNQPATS